MRVAWRSVQSAIRELGAWLGAESVLLPDNLPAPWARAPATPGSG
ncbi:MAG: hypothetical protein ACRDHD_00175 [Candidatus Limnocylindria bacterium]